MIRINHIKVKFKSFDEFEAELNLNLQHCEATCDGVMWDRSIDEYIHPCNSFSDFNWDIHSDRENNDQSEQWKEDDHREQWKEDDHWEHEDLQWEHEDHHWEHEDHHWDDDDHDSNQNFHFAGADLGYKPSKKRQ